MFNRHRCTWNETSRRFTSGQNKIKNLETRDSGQDELFDLIKRDQYGFTVVELHCSECKNVKFEESLGDQTFK